MLDDNLPINLAAIYKLYHYIQKRYGYPDIQILATLKQKFWISRFLMMLILDPGLILIFRVAICCLRLLFCSNMAPLN